MGPAVFLHVLNADEQQWFVEAALTLAHADDHLDEREELLLETLRLEMGMEEVDLTPSEAAVVQGHLAAIESGVAKNVVLFELAGVTTADGEAHADEVELLKDWAAAMEVPPDRVETFVDYAMRAHQLFNEARDLIAAT